MPDKLNDERINILKSAPHSKKCKIFWSVAWNEMWNKKTKDVLEEK